MYAYRDLNPSTCSSFSMPLCHEVSLHPLSLSDALLLSALVLYPSTLLQQVCLVSYQGFHYILWIDGFTVVDEFVVFTIGEGYKEIIKFGRSYVEILCTDTLSEQLNLIICCIIVGAQIIEKV